MVVVSFFVLALVGHDRDGMAPPTQVSDGQVSPVTAVADQYAVEGRPAAPTTFTDLAGQILALSKMNWNNDALYDSLPCTIRYAQTLARTLKHMPGLLPVPYDYRLFI
jgi:hypothetical protein